MASVNIPEAALDKYLPETANPFQPLANKANKQIAAVTTPAKKAIKPNTKKTLNVSSNKCRKVKEQSAPQWGQALVSPEISFLHSEHCIIIQSLLGWI